MRVRRKCGDPRWHVVRYVKIMMTTFDWEEAPTSSDSIVTETVRIVVADDDDDIRDLVATTLRLDGYDVSEAKDGVALLDIVATANPPHVIICDVRMPGIDGLTMLAALRRIGSCVPIIMMSAYCTIETQEEARASGANVFFTKPFDLDDLRTAVLNLRPRRRT